MSETATPQTTDEAFGYFLRMPKEIRKATTPRARQRGMGRLFQRGGKWWIAYYIKKEGRSVEVRESAGSTEADARRALKRRQDELSASRLGARPFQGPRQERV